MGSTDKNNVWYRGLKDLELWQISAGLTRLKDSNESYNPSLPYFRGLCTKAEPPRIKKHESLSAPERTEEQKQNAKKVLDMAKSILKSTGAR